MPQKTVTVDDPVITDISENFIKILGKIHPSLKFKNLSGEEARTQFDISGTSACRDFLGETVTSKKDKEGKRYISTKITDIVTDGSIENLKRGPARLIFATRNNAQGVADWKNADVAIQFSKVNGNDVIIDIVCSAALDSEKIDGDNNQRRRQSPKVQKEVPVEDRRKRWGVTSAAIKAARETSGIQDLLISPASGSEKELVFIYEKLGFRQFTGANRKKNELMFITIGTMNKKRASEEEEFDPASKKRHKSTSTSQENGSGANKAAGSPRKGSGSQEKGPKSPRKGSGSQEKGPKSPSRSKSTSQEKGPKSPSRGKSTSQEKVAGSPRKGSGSQEKGPKSPSRSRSTSQEKRSGSEERESGSSAIDKGKRKETAEEKRQSQAAEAKKRNDEKVHYENEKRKHDDEERRKEATKKKKAEAKEKKSGGDAKTSDRLVKESQAFIERENRRLDKIRHPEKYPKVQRFSKTTGKGGAQRHRKILRLNHSDFQRLVGQK